MGNVLKRLSFLKKKPSFITPIIKRFNSIPKKEVNSQEVDIFQGITDGVNKTSYELDILSGEKPSVLNRPVSEERKKIPLSKLEEAYIRDAHLFNGINLYTKLIMGAGYKIRCDNEKILSFIGLWQREVNLKGILDELVTHMLVFGNAYLEIVYDSSKSKIVGILPLNPKRIDYLKSLEGSIQFNPDTLKPLGYTQKIPFGLKKGGDKYLPPKEISLGDDEVYFPDDHIAHFKLFTIGEGFYGIGLIEPVYQLSLIKFNVEDGFGEAAHRTGMPLVTAQLGDETHQPTAQMVNDTVDQILKMKANSVGGFPYYVDLKILESQRGLESLSDALKYFVGSQAASLGIPLSLLTGSGEKTNRSVLLIQYQLLERTMRFIQNRINEGFNKIFNIFAELNNWDLSETPITIDWNEVSITDMNEKAKRLRMYVDAGVLTPDEEIEELIRNIEDLPLKTDGNKNNKKPKESEKPVTIDK